MSHRKESGADVYNRMYLEDDLTYERPESSPYYPVFMSVVRKALAVGACEVLEVGCGSGTLGRMLIESGIGYRGFDLAVEGVKKAAERATGAKRLFVGDATDPNSYSDPYDTIVCIEVLEHVEADREVVKRWRPGCGVIASVPNFDYETHVRKFVDESDVLDRYGDLIQIEEIVRIKKSIWSHDLKVLDYLRKLRWARNDIKSLAGLVGVNQFDWYGGWFLFSGRRKAAGAHAV